MPGRARSFGGAGLGNADIIGDVRAKIGEQFDHAGAAAEHAGAGGGPHGEAIDPIDDEQAARAAAMLPSQLIQPGEIIILLLKPSPLFVLLNPLRSVIGISVLTAIAVLTSQYLAVGLSPRQWLIAGFAVLAGRVFWECMEWLSRVYVLTDQRVIQVGGVVRVGVFEARLEQIQNTNLLFSLRERLFGLGTLSFSTAGTATAEAAWRMVSNPLEVHRTVIQSIRRYRR